MIRKIHLRYCSAIVLCCIITSYVTKTIVRSNMRNECGRSIDFYYKKDVLYDFVQRHQLTHGEHLHDEQLPPELMRIGITSVYRNGRLLHFVLEHTSMLADDAISEFIYQLDNNGGTIEEVMKLTESKTYHIQHLTSAPGWYYWLHN